MTANSVAKPYLEDGDLTLYHGDALAVLQGLPAGIAQTCVTSPPYWGLRDYGADGQLGLEATPTLYVQNMVSLFREVWRVLRDDGSLWLNLGDTYGANNTGGSGAQDRLDPAHTPNAWANHRESSRQGVAIRRHPTKPKDLVGIPWQVAFALQTDGWYLRSDIIWSKPNPMPESVTDRPTKSHEYLFLLSKQPRYFYDADAIREPHSPGSATHPVSQYAAAVNGPMNHARTPESDRGDARRFLDNQREYNPAGRNRRSVWTIPTQPFPEAHFATYPEELVRPCILAGTSEKGECVECGAPWQRQIELGEFTPSNGRGGAVHSAEYGARMHGLSERSGVGEVAQGFGRYERETTGWHQSCECHFPGSAHESERHRPQLVLDPFIGSGTTSLVARKHGRRSIGIDLSTEYLAIAAKRTQQLSLLGGAA